MTNHPLSTQTRPQIHLYTKGKQATILRDSYLLMKEAAPKLEKDASLLYINTLTSASSVEQLADKLSERYDRKLCTFSASSRVIMQKLDFLEHTITAKNVKLVIINSFEFAAIFSRQKTLLASWLREMRDAYGLRIAVYSMYPEQTHGGLGSLAWLSDRSEQVGDWKYDEEISDTLRKSDNAEAATEEFMKKLDQDPDDSRDARFFVDTPGVLGFKSIADIMGLRSLKNKDLAPAPTHQLAQEHQSSLLEAEAVSEAFVEPELEMA